MPNPIRSSSQYRRTRALWLAGFRGQPHPCCLCGGLVDNGLPGTVPGGPTVEHLLPIRVIECIARDRAHAIALACDTSHWGLAHKRCQDQQGAQAANEMRAAAPRLGMVGASRVW